MTQISEAEKIIAGANSAEQKVDLLNEAAYNVRYSNPNLMKDLANKALAIASEAHYLQGMARSWQLLGILYTVLADYEESLKALQTALAIYEDIKYEQGMASVSGNIGVVYQSLGQYELAMQWQLKVIPFAENNEAEHDLALAYANLGEIFEHLEEYDSSLVYNLKSKEIFEKLGNETLMAVVYEHLGNVYDKKGEYTIAQEYMQLSLNTSEKNGDFSTQARAHMHLGRVLVQTKQLAQAIRSLLKAKSMFEELGNKDDVCATLLELAKLNFLADTLQDAEENGVKCLQLAEETQVPILQYKAHEILSKIYETKKDYPHALTHLRDYERIKSEVTQTNAQQRIAYIQAIFNFEKSEKEKEIYKLKTSELAEANFKVQKQKERLEKALAEIENSAKLLEERNKDILYSIQYALRIQKAVLPNRKQVEELLPNSFLYFKPKDIVSGDFYWIAKKNQFTLAAAADCTGHGVPAAIVSVIGNMLLNDIVLTKGVTDPGKILSQLHKGIRSLLRQDQEMDLDSETHDGMDIALISIDSEQKEIQFAGAFNSLFICKNNQIEEYKGDKYPIGGTQDEMFRIFTSNRIEYQTGDMLYMTTDGIANQIGGEESKRFKNQRFKDLIETISSKKLAEQLKHIETTMSDWMGNQEQMDDMLVWGIQL